MSTILLVTCWPVPLTRTRIKYWTRTPFGGSGGNQDTKSKLEDPTLITCKLLGVVGTEKRESGGEGES